MKNRSIRVRLTAWYSAVLLAGLALFAMGMWFALQQRLIAGVDGRLAQRVQGIRSMIRNEGAGWNRARLQHELSEFASEIPDGTFIQLRGQTGGLLVPKANQMSFSGWPEGALLAYRSVTQNGRAFRALVDAAEAGGEKFEILVAADLDEVDAIMRDFRNLLFFMVPAVLAAACLGGYWLSLRALRPVDEITAVAKSISVQNLSLRIAVPRTGDELQRMAETWNEVLERLEVAVRRIRQFTADASHELRTPLALIRATAELGLRREREPSAYRESLRAIESEAERMTALTESLLTLARADANGFDMPLAPVELTEVVHSVVEQNEALAAQKRVRLIAKTGGRPAPAMANTPGIRQLLLILIDNALKHTPEGGTVVVLAERRDGGSVLAVEDTGEGIAPSDLPHIFERFYRSDPARGSGSGFGLGLSIAQAIAQAHASKITVESSPGAGARFSLSLRG